MGINFGYGYTMHSRRHNGRLRTNVGRKPDSCRPVKVVDSITQKVIGIYESIEDTAAKLEVPQQSIRYFCNKNKNLELEDCSADRNNRIFMYNSTPVF